MRQETIRTAVRERYGAIAREEESGCGCAPSCCGGERGATASEEVGYSRADLASLPTGADLGLGSGHPTAAAELQPGETVLDLGSGAGIDCFLAAHAVGPSGRVIGVDMTPEMIARARRNAAEGGYDRVEFRLGEIEALPVADATVDVIVSNCVLNLSADRERAFEEAFRVLKPGGRLVVSDLLSEAQAPEPLQQSPEIVSGCLPVPRDTYVGQLERAGFRSVEIVEERVLEQDRLSLGPDVIRSIEASADQVQALAEFRSTARAATLRATKPGRT